MTTTSRVKSSLVTFLGALQSIVLTVLFDSPSVGCQTHLYQNFNNPFQLHSLPHYQHQLSPSQRQAIEHIVKTNYRQQHHLYDQLQLLRTPEGAQQFAGSQFADRRASPSPSSHQPHDHSKDDNGGKLLVCYYTTRQTAPFWPKDAREFVVPPEGFAVNRGDNQQQSATSLPSFDFGGPLVLPQESLAGDPNGVARSSTQARVLAQQIDFPNPLDNNDIGRAKRKSQPQVLRLQDDSRHQPAFGSSSSSSTLSFNSVLGRKQSPNTDRSGAGKSQRDSLILQALANNHLVNSLIADSSAPSAIAAGGLAGQQSVTYSIVGADGQEMVSRGGNNGFGTAQNQQQVPVVGFHQNNGGVTVASELTQTANRQQQVVFASAPPLVPAAAGGSRALGTSVNQLAYSSPTTPSSANNELDTKSHLLVPAAARNYHQHNHYGSNRREAAATTVNLPLYQQQQQVDSSSSALNSAAALGAQRAKSLQVSGDQQQQVFTPTQNVDAAATGNPLHHRLQLSLASKQQQKLNSYPQHELQLHQFPANTNQQPPEASIQPKSFSLGSQTASPIPTQTPLSTLPTTTQSTTASIQQQDNLLTSSHSRPRVYPSDSTTRATLTADISAGDKSSYSVIHGSSDYLRHAQSSPSDALMAQGAPQTIPTPVQQPGTPGAMQLVPANQPLASATLISSPLSTMFDVFGAASNYLMRFKPSSLMTPSSFASLNRLAPNQSEREEQISKSQQLIIPASAQQTLVSLGNSSVSSSFMPPSFGSSFFSDVPKSPDGNKSQSGAQSTSSGRTEARSFLARLTGSGSAQVQRREDVCGRTIQTPERRIIGGEGARYGEFPYQVHIKIAKHQCGGALVDRQSIVTAAHCVYHFITRAPVSKLQIVIGAYDIEDEQYQELPPQYFKVNKVKLHPNFRFSASHPDRYDIAILKLDKPVRYTDNVLPVCLPSKDLKFESMVGTVTGFGKTDPSLSNRYGTRLLQKVDVPIIENNECERWHRTRGIDLKIFPEMMCAGYEDGLKDACVGDSGGPLVVKTPTGPNGSFRWTLAGITSAGFGCAQSRQPGIYHRVSHTVDWILENLD